MKQYETIYIYTVAKVGSSTLYHSLNKKYKVEHGHSLLFLEDVLKNKSNCLFIAGIRNPINRNLSYFFQTYKDKFYNEVKTKKNDYKGEYCYNKDLIDCNDSNKYIKAFHNFEYLYSFNDWFYEFLNLTNIREFDKDKGYQLYKLDNNNTLLFYTLESLNKNKKDLCKLLEITKIKDSNKTSDKGYSKLYSDVKKNIKYKKSYITDLLDTDIIKLFYNQNEIDEFKKVNYIS